MGIVISIEEFRKRRCLEALLADLGLPGYCEECGPDLLVDPDETRLPSSPPPQPPRKAQILRFPGVAPATTRKKRTVAAGKAPRQRTHMS